MNSKLMVVSLLVLTASFSAHATPFNGYIVKVKDGSQFLSSKAVSTYGHVTKTASTSFGTFGRLETNQGLSDKAMLALANNPEIEYIEPNYIITVDSVKASPKDAMFTKQWGLANTGKNGGGIFSSGLAGEDINVSKAWDITTGATGAQTIKIAVIDTGVDYNHPDLKGQMDINTAELNGNAGVDDDGNGYVDDIYGYDFANNDGDPADGHGHGTHCAGVIGASHNSIGIAGVMANVKIVGIKFLTDKGSGETIDAISAIDYAIKRGVRVMSNSWGGGDKEQSLLDAITAAETAGITFVAAAGNDSSNNDKTPSYPANYEVSNVVSVGSYASNGARSSFSNYGVSSVHVTAPGTGILSTYKGSYSSLSGTSMATPHVSGIIGLILSKEPNLSPAEIRERLIKTSTQTSKLKTSSLSGGRVDAYRALTNK
ncbi:MAG: S8 family serine peptidase [Bdellovibrionales bacterium]|nr:S8 family serine peptidase [Bdellovibrionales bacterium]